MRGLSFKNAEEAFQGVKAITFNDNESLAKILASKTPASAKSLGRKVKGFNDAIWSARKLDLMREIVTCKFSQNGELKTMLIATGDAVLAEATRDTFWGIGVKKGALEGQQEVWGKNHLGKILMEVRASLTGGES